MAKYKLILKGSMQPCIQSTALIITAHSLAFTPSLYSTFGLYKLYHVCTNKKMIIENIAKT